MDPRDAFEKQDVQIANLVAARGQGPRLRDHQVGHGRHFAEARKEMDHQAVSRTCRTPRARRSSPCPSIDAQATSTS